MGGGAGQTPLSNITHTKATKEIAVLQICGGVTPTLRCEVHRYAAHLPPLGGDGLLHRRQLRPLLLQQRHAPEGVASAMAAGGPGGCDRARWGGGWVAEEPREGELMAKDGHRRAPWNGWERNFFCLH